MDLRLAQKFANDSSEIDSLQICAELIMEHGTNWTCELIGRVKEI